MSLSIGVLLIFCGLGVAQCLFLAVYLFTFKEGDRFSNRLLSLLLIALAIRLAKSLTYYFFTLDPVFMNLGYAAHCAIVPLLFLYVRIRYAREKWTLWNFLHLFPAVIIVLWSGILEEGFWNTTGYSLLLYHTLIYIAFTWWQYLRLRREGDTFENRWMISLLLSISILGLAYFSNFVLGLTAYIAGPALFSLMIYYLSFLVFRFHGNIIGLPVGGKLARTWSSGESGSMEKKLNQCLAEKVFLDPTLTVQKLAYKMDVPAYRLSQFINDHYKQSFTDLINAQRVTEASGKLKSSSEMQKKIAAIAFESGFNTLSAFNYAFKKVTNQTPSEFRREG